MGATVQTVCNIRRYCTLLGVILHVAKADIALLIESTYIVRLARLRVHVAKSDTALLLESMYIHRTINN